MTTFINAVTENKEDLVQLKKMAEDIITSDVFAEEPEEFQDKFEEEVYLPIQKLLINGDIDSESFNTSMASIKSSLKEIMVDFASRSNLEFDIEKLK